MKNRNPRKKRVFAIKLSEEEYDLLDELSYELGCTKKKAAISAIKIVAKGVLENKYGS